MIQRILPLNPLRMRFPEATAIHVHDEVYLEQLAVPCASELSKWPAIRGIDLLGITETRFALTTRFDADEDQKLAKMGEAQQKLTATLGALEVISPSLEQHLFLAYQLGGGAAQVIGVGVPFLLTPTSWAAEAVWPVSDLSVLPIVAERTRRALAQDFRRIQSGLTLYFQGLRHEIRHLRTLFWMMGVDALLMAQNRSELCERLRCVLGEQCAIFPSSRCRQPRITVGDVVEDLYTLRSEIAHGSQPSARFNDVVGLWDTAGEPINTTDTRAEMLEQSAMFVLSRLLKLVLSTDLFNDVETPSAWRQRLRTRW